MPPGLRAIGTGGFGDARNSYAWSMAWFRGRLYVGTARSAMCVERATFDFYLPWAGYYTQRLPGGVRCPASIHAADLRAEIWRFAPRRERWTLVYRSPSVPNPRAPGHRIALDIGYRGMAVMKRPHRPPALYVAATSADEIVPELARRQPPRILRTTDGRRFEALRHAPRLIRLADGARRPVGYRALEQVGRRLYVTASAGLTGDGVVLRIDHPGGRSPRFRQVSPPDLRVFELQRFDGALYAGTGDSAAGYGVWRMTGGARPAWAPVVTGGAGRGPTVTSVVSMEPYRGRLYVGASGWGNSPFPPSELIRIGPDGRWDVVVGSSREAGGVVRAPVSALPDGFGNPYNSHFWRMQSDRGALLLGTNDWSWSLHDAPGLDGALRSELGFDLYATCDGSHWWTVTRNGFRRRATEFGLRTMASTPAGLFLGSTDHVRGAGVYRARRPACRGRTPAWPAAGRR
jgi:hypothetical protein